MKDWNYLEAAVPGLSVISDPVLAKSDSELSAADLRRRFRLAVTFLSLEEAL